MPRRDDSSLAWTSATTRTTLECMPIQQQRSSPGRDERLTPWLIHDLPRIAWIVEYRLAELTEQERQIVRDAITRMQRALDHDAI